MVTLTDFQDFMLEFIRYLTNSLIGILLSIVCLMKKYSHLIFVAILVQSCDKVIDSADKEWGTLNCNNLKIGILNMDSDIVKFEINKLVKDLNPKVTTSDKFGQRENIDLLIERLNKQCNDIKTELICYACIYTYPPQSEILVTVDSARTSVKRVIDIMTPSNVNLSCVRVHQH